LFPSLALNFVFYFIFVACVVETGAETYENNGSGKKNHRSNKENVGDSKNTNKEVNAKGQPNPANVMCDLVVMMILS
jgi:hypothetical protein